MLIATSIVRNEADRYLASWLDNVRTYADRHVILDDASDDETIDILRERARRDPTLVLEIGSESLFLRQEQRLRARLWECTRHVASEGDWILVVDADEFFDRELPDRKRELLARRERLIRLRNLDLWKEGHYRVDGYWSSPVYRLFRFEDRPYGPALGGLNQWPLPEYARQVRERNLPGQIYCSSIRLLHKGWLRDSDKRHKYAFYLPHLDSAFDRAHVQSALESRPRLRTYRPEYWSPQERGSRLRLAARELVDDLTRPARMHARGWARRVFGPALAAALRSALGRHF